MTHGATSVGVITTDAELNVRSWDPWLARARGIPEAGMAGRSLLELAPEIEQRGLLAALRRVLNDGVVQVLAPAFHHYLLHCTTEDGAPYFDAMQQHVTISPLRNGASVDGVVITIEDVTQRCVRERQLAEQLKNHDEAIRLRAARKLAERPHDPAPLLDALGDPSWQVRRAAVTGIVDRANQELIDRLVATIRDAHTDIALLNATLTTLAESKLDALPTLIRLLDDEEPSVRMYTALTLGNMHDPRAVRPLLDLLDDADLNVRYHAVEALGRIKAPAALQPLLDVVRTRDPYLAFAALDALASIAQPAAQQDVLPLLDDDVLGSAAIDALAAFADERAVVPLLNALRREAPPLRVCHALASIQRRLESEYGEGILIADIVRADLDAGSIEAIAGSLGDAGDEELAAAATVLGWLDFPGMDRLLAGLLPHPTAGRAAQDALVARGPRAVAVIAEELAHSDPHVRKAAASALGRIGAPEAVPSIIPALSDDDVEVVIAAAAALGGIGDAQGFRPLLELLAHEEAAVRGAAIAGISSIGHPHTAREAQRLLSSGEPRLRECGARIAGYFGFANCLPELLALTEDPIESVRRAAAEQLGYFSDPQALTALGKALRDQSPQVRAAAARALAHVDQPEALTLVETALADAAPRVRYVAAQAVAAQNWKSLAPRLRELLRDDEAVPVRIAAAQALGALRDADAAALLTDLVETAETDLACAAIEALGALPGVGAEAPLATALGSHDARRQLATLEAIESSGRDDLLPHVQRLARSTASDEVRRRALQVMARHGGPGIDAVLALAAEPEWSADCIAALSRIEHAELDHLIRGLNHVDAHTRWATVESLARMKRIEASRALTAALEDEDASVRYATAQALARLDLA